MAADGLPEGWSPLGYRLKGCFVPTRDRWGAAVDLQHDVCLPMDGYDIFSVAYRGVKSRAEPTRATANLVGGLLRGEGNDSDSIRLVVKGFNRKP